MKSCRESVACSPCSPSNVYSLALFAFLFWVVPVYWYNNFGHQCHRQRQRRQTSHTHSTFVPIICIVIAMNECMWTVKPYIDGLVYDCCYLVSASQRTRHEPHNRPSFCVFFSAFRCWCCCFVLLLLNRFEFVVWNHGRTHVDAHDK